MKPGKGLNRFSAKEINVCLVIFIPESGKTAAWIRSIKWICYQRGKVKQAFCFENGKYPVQFFVNVYDMFNNFGGNYGIEFPLVSLVAEGTVNQGFKRCNMISH